MCCSHAAMSLQSWLTIAQQSRSLYIEANRAQQIALAYYVILLLLLFKIVAVVCDDQLCFGDICMHFGCVLLVPSLLSIVHQLDHISLFVSSFYTLTGYKRRCSTVTCLQYRWKIYSCRNVDENMTIAYISQKMTIPCTLSSCPFVAPSHFVGKVI